MPSTLLYHRADERPDWVATVTVNGVADNLSSGYTFTVKVYGSSATPVLTKTTNITGATGGVVTVAWTPNELDLPPGRYRVILTALRTSDNREWSVQESMMIVSR